MKKITIENEITLNTLRKIYKTQEWWQSILDDKSEMKQFLENLDNGFVTKESLYIIVNDIFNEKAKGGFRSTLDCFGTRNKKRFIKSKLEELMEGK